MQQSLFVGGLDFSITSEELTKIFSEHAEVVSAKVITDMYSGRSKGFAFVEVASAEMAAICIAALDNYLLKGRKITVRIAEKRQNNNTRREYRPQ